MYLLNYLSYEIINLPTHLSYLLMYLSHLPIHLFSVPPFYLPAYLCYVIDLLTHVELPTYVCI